MDIATEATLDGNTLDLRAKPARLLAGNVALVRAHHQAIRSPNL
jgi:hypothetical protein